MSRRLVSRAVLVLVAGLGVALLLPEPTKIPGLIPVTNAIAAEQSTGPAEVTANENPSPEDASKSEPEVLYWVAPMDPAYRRDKPGKSPMGMDLVPVYADAGTGSGPGFENAVRIDPAVQQNLGARTEVTRIRPLWRRIEATGYVGFDEGLLNHIHMRTSGWIENLQVETVGERVRKGQLLFEFYAPELVNAQKEYLQTIRRGETRLVAAGRRKLVALGMDPAEIDRLDNAADAEQTIAVFAPEDGVVTALHARDGMYVKPENEVMSLAGLSSVWMQAEIFETQADWVQPGQSAEARLNYLPGEVFPGTVDLIYPVLDPETRTLKVRLRFDNPKERLKPNMYAAVTIYGRTHEDALTIPRDALIRGSVNDRVVVALGDGWFRANEVMTGIESGPWVEIISGLKAGDKVVSSAQFLIDSEASLTGSLRRLEHHADDSAKQESGVVFASGVIQSIDRTNRRLIIDHGPIDSLGWPPMTMEFSAEPAVELGAVQVGQGVHFAIKPSAEGVYVLEMIHLVDTRSGEQSSGAKNTVAEQDDAGQHEHD